MRVNKYSSNKIKPRAYKNFMLKLNYTSIPKQRRYFYFYRRFNYFKPRLGRRRRRLSKFFFYRPPRRFPRKFSNRLRKKFIYFLRKIRFSKACAYTSFTRNFFHLFLRFYKIFLLRYRRNRRVHYIRGHYFTLSKVFFKLIHNRLTSSNLRFKNKLLIYRHSFLMRRRFKLPVTNSIFRKALSLASRKQQSAFVIKLKKRRRLLKSLFKRLCFYDLKKVFFVTLRASKNNTMLSVFDFLGNLLYWKTSKVVGMPGKKKGTKMAAEFLAYHLTRYLRSRKFFSSKFIFTLFGLRRHFRVVVKFIKRQVKLKNILAMLSKSKVPHNGCFLKKKKHKGWRRFRKRKLLY